jgi:RNA polymerase sigma-70 factor (ECF subfamily)
VVTDAELVARTLAGRTEAFDDLVARYHERCLRFAVHMVGSAADAEDAVQDAFIRAYRGLARYREQQQFGAWLFRILANRCRTALAARKRREARVIADSAAVERSSSASAPPVDAGIALRAALAALDPEQREAFLLHFAEGLGYTEMAEITGAGESALKMRVKRARDRMRALLEET